MKILCFSYDEALLLPEDEGNESQYRQSRYCDFLDQEKIFVVLGSVSCRGERLLAGGRIRVMGAGSRFKAWQAALGFLKGVWQGWRMKPDAVEYQDPRLAGLVAYAVSRLLRKPLLGGIFNDFTDNPTWIGGSIKRRIYNAVGKWVLRRTFRVRCDSETTAVAFQKKGYPQVWYVPFYIPWLERFRVSPAEVGERQVSWNKAPVVLCVARLAEEKNIALLLRAFAKTKTARGRGRLVIVGGGSLERELRALAARLGLDESVDWIGPVKYLALPEVFRRAHIFALPSNSETSARVLVLAQAMKLPTVTTDTSGCREIVRDGKTGFVTPLGEEETFAVALERLLTDGPLYQRILAAAGSTGAVERHGDLAIRTGLRVFYENVVRANA